MRRKDLEARKVQITEFYDCLQEQVDAGIISKELARTIAKREYGEKTYAQLIEEIDAQLHRMPVRGARNAHVAVLGAVLVLAFGFALYSGAFTGLFTLTDEQFYDYEFSRTFATDDIAVLSLPENTSSLRVNGEISGAGTADVWLQSGTQRYLLARFDSSEEQSPLTGFFTAATDALGITEESVVIAGNGTDNETGNGTDNPQEGLPAPQDGIVELPEDAAPINTTLPDSTNNDTTTTNTTESTPPESPEGGEADAVPLTPSTPPQEELIPPVGTSVSRELDNECVETCALQSAAAPFMIIVDIEGDVTVRIDSLVYGLLPEQQETAPEQPEAEPEQPETEPVVDIGAPRSDDSPLDPPVPPPSGGAVLDAGSLCSSDDQCASGVCRANRFEGVDVPARCVQQDDSCVSGSGVSAAGDVSGASTCYAAGNGGFWLASPGNGRYEIKNAAGELVAVIDRYGVMAISGNASFSSPAQRSGWVMESSAGEPTLSIDSNGNLFARGALSQRVTPAPTAGNDFIVKDSNGEVAVLTEDGAVQLAGILVADAALQ